jgi:hypothetical protein
VVVVVVVVVVVFVVFVAVVVVPSPLRNHLPPSTPCHPPYPVRLSAQSKTMRLYNLAASLHSHFFIIQTSCSSSYRPLVLLPKTFSKRPTFCAHLMLLF